MSKQHEISENIKDVRNLLEYVKTPNGSYPCKTIDNFYLIFCNDNYFSDIRLNTMRMQACRVSPSGERTYWEDADDSIVAKYIEDHYYKLKSKSTQEDAFRVFLSERKFSPAQEAIKGIIWDGQPHCKRFFITWLKADDTTYTEEATRLLFRQMVDRAFRPGCKADYVIVLKGRQGSAKSTICRWLALEDEMYASVTTIDQQKGYEAVQGKFVCELEELLATVGEGTRKDNAVKAFISSQNDHYRRPYDRRSSDNPRSCIFVGTTNMDKFLSDPTGNRRWFPVECRLKDGIFVYEHEEEIKHDIRQCLAEMYHAYINKLPLASPIPDKSLFRKIKEKQEASEMEDYRVGAIAEYISSGEFENVCCIQLWKEALHNDKKEMTRNDANEIGEILRMKLGCTIIGKRYFSNFGTQHAYKIPKKLQRKTKDSKR